MRNKNNIVQLSQLVLDNFDKIANEFDIKYVEYDNRITMACPVHNGDNDGACVIFRDGESISGNWCCFTHGCEQQYGMSIVGFIRGILENTKDREVSYGEVVRFIERTTKRKISHVKPVRDDNYDFCRFVDYFVKDKSTSSISIPKGKLISTLKIPSQYYVKRNYSREVLTKYSIGFCNTKGKPFYLRTVVPVFDDTGLNAVGFTARTINSECSKCGWYHYNQHKCPETRLEKYFASKWVNSKGFSKTDYLYNTWSAKPYIEESKTAILVEGAGDVWRLEECGIHNSLGMFGCKLNEKQVAILDSLGVQRLIVVLDNDKAGKEGKEKIELNYGRYFNLEFITTLKNDVGDSSHGEIKRLFNGKYISNQREEAERQEQHYEVPLWV